MVIWPLVGYKMALPPTVQHNVLYVTLIRISHQSSQMRSERALAWSNSGRMAAETAQDRRPDHHLGSPHQSGHGFRLSLPAGVPSGLGSPASLRHHRTDRPSLVLATGRLSMVGLICPRNQGRYMMRKIWRPYWVSAALPDLSKSPPRSPSSVCRSIPKPLPYSPPCLRVNWKLPLRHPCLDPPEAH